jgi:hypothetical protein
MNTDIHALSEIRTHDPSVRASEDSSCLRLSGHCNRQNLIKFYYWLSQKFHSNILYIHTLFNNILDNSLYSRSNSFKFMDRFQNQINFAMDNVTENSTNSERSVKVKFGIYVITFYTEKCFGRKSFGRQQTLDAFFKERGWQLLPKWATSSSTYS